LTALLISFVQQTGAFLQEEMFLRLIKVGGKMRKYVVLPKPTDNVRKLMIYETTDGVYVFLYDTVKDAPCFADMFFETLEEAEEYCQEYGVEKENWTIVADPLEGCSHDLIECN
jgi:hypothetical protein